MLYAIAANRQRITATLDMLATCPCCAQIVRAYCGEINAWHWRHQARVLCDSWFEKESDWHFEWKQCVPVDRVEVLIEKGNQKHIADIIKLDGTVVKLQASYISPEEIRIRESFYRKMVWLFDGRALVEDDPYTPGGHLELRRKGKIHTFRWKHPRKHIGFTLCPAFLDLGGVGIFRLKKLYLDGPPYGGWGHLYSRSWFSNWLNLTAAVDGLANMSRHVAVKVHGINRVV
jgi:competence protein CoiA